MAAEIPYDEPGSFHAGDTVTWYKELSDYLPADGWTLKYSFRNATSKFNITATTSGTKYLATVSAATSSTIAPGRYDWVAYVTKGTAPTQEQYTVATGASLVLPNLSADVVYDARSESRKIYDDLITAYKSFIASNGVMSSFSVGGKSVSFSGVHDIIQQIEHWRVVVQQEEDADLVTKGWKNPRQVGVRLNRP